MKAQRKSIVDHPNSLFATPDKNKQNLTKLLGISVNLTPTDIPKSLHQRNHSNPTCLTPRSMTKIKDFTTSSKNKSFVSGISHNLKIQSNVLEFEDNYASNAFADKGRQFKRPRTSKQVRELEKQLKLKFVKSNTREIMEKCKKEFSLEKERKTSNNSENIDNIDNYENKNASENTAIEMHNFFNLKASLEEKQRNLKKIKKEKDNFGNTEFLQKMQEIKNKSFIFLSDSLKMEKKLDIVNESKKIIEIACKKMKFEMKEKGREMESLITENNRLENKLKDLELTNKSLNHSNKRLQDQLSELQANYEFIKKNNSDLEDFKDHYHKIKAHLPGVPIEKIIDKISQLEYTSLELTKQINDLEEDKRIIFKKNVLDKNEFDEKIFKLNQFQAENSKDFWNFQKEKEKLGNVQNEFQELQVSYISLVKKIFAIFNEWNSKIYIFHSTKDKKTPKANLDNPEEMLEIILKMVKISTNENCLDYLRKIIVSANLLQRKYFPEHVNEKFDPDKIYERILRYINSLHNQLNRMDAEIQVLKKKIKINKIITDEPKTKKSNEFRNRSEIVRLQETHQEKRPPVKSPTQLIKFF